jgi:hypothetical protein
MSRKSKSTEIGSGLVLPGAGSDCKWTQGSLEDDGNVLKLNCYDRNTIM